MRNVRDNIAIRQEGDRQIACKAYDGDDEDGCRVGDAHIQTLLVFKRTGGENHQRDGQQGQLLSYVEKGVLHIGGAHKPEQMHCHQNQEGLKEIIGAEVGKLLLPIPLSHPVDEQQKP